MDKLLNEMGNCPFASPLIAPLTGDSSLIEVLDQYLKRRTFKSSVVSYLKLEFKFQISKYKLLLPCTHVRLHPQIWE